MMVRVKAIFNHKNNQNKVLVDDVLVDGEFFKTHSWLPYCKGMRNLRKGDIFTFNATECEYIGLSGDKQVLKRGFKDLSNISLERKKNDNSCN